jgi:predicted transcriptional regulator
MSAKDIQKLTPWGERKVRDVLKGLINKKFLFRTSKGRQNSYQANKKYFFVGEEVHNTWKDEEGTPAQTCRNTGTSTPQ